jgi:hypothetical protein
MSKTFHNYLKARERIESTAKSFAEKLNQKMVNKAKHKKKAELALKEVKIERQIKIDKIHEK